MSHDAELGRLTSLLFYNLDEQQAEGGLAFGVFAKTLGGRLPAAHWRL